MRIQDNVLLYQDFCKQSKEKTARRTKRYSSYTERHSAHQQFLIPGPKTELLLTIKSFSKAGILYLYSLIVKSYQDDQGRVRAAYKMCGMALGAAFTIDGSDDYIIDIRLSGRSTERSVSVASSRARVGYHRDIRFDKISDEGLGLTTYPNIYKFKVES